MCSQIGRDTGKSSEWFAMRLLCGFWHLLSVLRAAGGRRRRRCREDRAQRSERDSSWVGGEPHTCLISCIAAPAACRKVLQLPEFGWFVPHVVSCTWEEVACPLPANMVKVRIRMKDRAALVIPSQDIPRAQDIRRESRTY